MLRRSRIFHHHELLFATWNELRKLLISFTQLFSLL
jgi:hypothetical protein